MSPISISRFHHHHLGFFDHFRRPDQILRGIPQIPTKNNPFEFLSFCLSASGGSFEFYLNTRRPQYMPRVPHRYFKTSHRERSIIGNDPTMRQKFFHLP